MVERYENWIKEGKVGKNFEVNLQPEMGYIIRSMFMWTADQNYITARFAFYCGNHLDFLWLSLHSIEKYLKAALLFNGVSVKDIGHDIEKLYKLFLQLDSRLKNVDFINPNDKNFLWIDEDFDNFIKRLNIIGSANNRYLVNGYKMAPSDLLKVDQIIFYIRYHCRSFKINYGNHSELIDNFPNVQPSASNWYNEDGIMDGSQLPLDRLGSFVNSGVDKIFPDDGRSEFFARDNYPFFGAKKKSGHMVGWSLHSEPLGRYIDQLRSDGGKKAYMAAAVLEWSKKNIKFSSEYRAEINDAISKLEK